MARRVLIVGGGIGGLALGAALGQRGIGADLVEMRKDHAVHGVGIIQPWNLLRALRSLGVADRCIEVGFPFDGWEMHDVRGTKVGEHRSPYLRGDGIPAFNGISRRHLYEILRDAAVAAGTNIMLGKTFVNLHQERDRVSVALTDGTQRDYELVVGFDGIRSAVRQTLFTNDACTPVYTGFAAWRFTTTRPGGMTQGGVYFDFTGGTKAGIVPLSRQEMYLFLVTREPPYAKDKARLHRDLSERLANYGGLIAEVRAELKEADAVVYSPIEEVILPSPWYRGRVLVCGDAAHASAPHAAQGAGMAVEDAVVLAELVASEVDVDRIFSSFMTRRYRRCRAVQTASHLLLLQEMRAHGVEVVPQAEDADLTDAANHEQILAQPV